MTDTSVAAVLGAFAAKHRFLLPEGYERDFSALCELLLAYNEHTNLTAIRTPQGVAVRHFADSLSALAFDLVPRDARVIDVGCGAGFPGLPLLIARRDLSVTFLDSTAKKLKFTELACEKLGLTAAFCPVRAEDLANDASHREAYDVAVSRAVASLPVLAELCLPFVKVGGTFIAYKAESAAQEVELSQKAIPALGGRLENVYEIDLPAPEGEEPLHHALVVIRKLRETPKQYPRRYARILKNPL